MGVTHHTRQLQLEDLFEVGHHGRLVKILGHQMLLTGFWQVRDCFIDESCFDAGDVDFARMRTDASVSLSNFLSFDLPHSAQQPLQAGPVLIVLAQLISNNLHRQCFDSQSRQRRSAAHNCPFASKRSSVSAESSNRMQASITILLLTLPQSCYRPSRMTDLRCS